MRDAYLDPIHLPIVPPIDLNRIPSSGDISAFPLQLRDRDGLFYTDRPESDFIRVHQGVDLLAPPGTPVFAVTGGTVLESSDDRVLLLHDRGFIKFLTCYSEVRNVSVGVNEIVGSGDQIAEVKDFTDDRAPDHLHFEIRYLLDTINAAPTRANTLPVDPTNVLYQWEARSFVWDAAMDAGQVYDNVVILYFEEVLRQRQLRFLLVKVSGDDTRDLYLPLIDSSPANLSLIETVKQAFFHSKIVRIIWHESLFFSKIQGRSPTGKAAIIRNVKVLR